MVNNLCLTHYWPCSSVFIWWTYFTPVSSGFIVGFEYIFLCWVHFNMKMFLQNDLVKKWIYLFWCNVYQQILDEGPKEEGHRKTNQNLEVFKWIHVFWFLEHLNLWIDIKCGHLVRRYLEDVNKLLYLVEFHFNYWPILKVKNTNKQTNTNKNK